jgi:hypothetical protein
MNRREMIEDEAERLASDEKYNKLMESDFEFFLDEFDDDYELTSVLFALKKSCIEHGRDFRETLDMVADCI